MLQPLVVALGCRAGLDGHADRDAPPQLRHDAILFANTGSEKQGTYDFIPIFERWLRGHGFPPITIVQYQPVSAPC
jgi:hypothetical protein